MLLACVFIVAMAVAGLTCGVVLVWRARRLAIKLQAEQLAALTLGGGAMWEFVYFYARANSNLNGVGEFRAGCNDFERVYYSPAAFAWARAMLSYAYYSAEGYADVRAMLRGFDFGSASEADLARLRAVFRLAPRLQIAAFMAIWRECGAAAGTGVGVCAGAGVRVAEASVSGVIAPTPGELAGFAAFAAARAPLLAGELDGDEWQGLCATFAELWSEYLGEIWASAEASAEAARVAEASVGGFGWRNN